MAILSKSNLHTPDNLKQLIKNKAFKLSHGDFSIQLFREFIGLEVKEDQYTHFQLDIQKSILEDFGFKGIIFHRVTMSKNKILFIKVVSENGSIPIYNNTQSRIFLMNTDILKGDVHLDNIGISILGVIGKGQVTIIEDGIMYKNEDLNTFWRYLEHITKDITSINYGVHGGFYLPIVFESMEYMYQFIRNEDSIQQFRKHIPHLNHFSIVFGDVYERYRAYLDFENNSNNYIKPCPL